MRVAIGSLRAVVLVREIGLAVSRLLMGEAEGAIVMIVVMEAQTGAIEIRSPRATVSMMLIGLVMHAGATAIVPGMTGRSVAGGGAASVVASVTHLHLVVAQRVKN
jgi:hypothetical protein